MPGLGVSVAVFEGDSVLLTRRADMPIWCLPSGGVSDGETVAQAAVRETREETGIEARLDALVGIYSRPNWWGGGTHGVLFRGSQVGGKLLRGSDETVDAGYFDIGNLPEDLLWWHYQRILDAHSRRTGVVMVQDSRPLVDGGRAELEHALRTGIVSVQEFLSEVGGSPKAHLQHEELHQI